MRRGLISLLLVLLLQFIASIATGQRKTVVVVYDDSGSMGSGKGSRCHSVSYAIQVMTAFLTEEDKLFVVRMSASKTPVEIDLKHKQSAMVRMATWSCNGQTPIATVYEAIHLLNKKGNEEKWLIIFTDGEFNTFAEADRIFIGDFIKKGLVKVMLLNIDMPHGSFAKTLSGLGVKDIYHSSSTPEKVIESMEAVSATVMTLPKSGLVPRSVSGKKVSLLSIYPLKRIVVLDQVSSGPVNEVKDVSASGQRLSFTDSFKAQKDNMNSKITHIVSSKKNSIMPQGAYQIEFNNNVNIKNIKFLPQVALDVDVRVAGSIKYREGNRIVVCQNKNEVEIIVRIIASDGNAISPDLQKLSSITLFFGQQSISMVFKDSVFTHRIRIKEPVNISVSAVHHGYYSFRSNIYRLEVESCPVISLPKENEYPTFKVTESENAKGIYIRPLLDGKPVDLDLLPPLELITKGTEKANLEIVRKDNAWYLSNAKIKCPCFAKGKRIPVGIELWSGSYESKLDEAIVYLTVEDVPLYKKCLTLILWILGLMVALWYLIGIIRKPRFDRKCNIICIHERPRNTRKVYSYRFKSNVFNRWLIPYKPEKITIDGIVFMASGKRNFIYASCRSLNMLKGRDELRLDGLELIAGELKKDLRMGMKIKLERIESPTSNYVYIYLKKIDNQGYY